MDGPWHSLVGEGRSTSLGLPDRHQETVDRGAEVCPEVEWLFHPSECGDSPAEVSWIAGHKATQLTACSFPSCGWTQGPGARCPRPRVCAFGERAPRLPGVLSQSSETGAPLLCSRTRRIGHPGLGTQILTDLVTNLIVRTRNPGGGLTALARPLSKPQERAAIDPRAGRVCTPRRSAAVMATLLADALG